MSTQPPRYVTVGSAVVPRWLWLRLVAEVGPARAADLASDPTTLEECLRVLRARTLADWQRRHGRRPLAERVRELRQEVKSA